jgi:hypothetical protein
MVRGFSARLCFLDFEPRSFADFAAILGAFYLYTVIDGFVVIEYLTVSLL